MTVKEWADYIGKSALWTAAPGVVVEVVIEDVRKVFGRTDYLIHPKIGRGHGWVGSDSVEVKA